MTIQLKNPCIQCKGKGLFRLKVCPRCKGKGRDPWKPGEMRRNLDESNALIGWEYKFPKVSKELEVSVKDIVGLPLCKKCNGSGGLKGNCSHCSGSGWENF